MRLLTCLRSHPPPLLSGLPVTYEYRKNWGASLPVHGIWSQHEAVMATRGRYGSAKVREDAGGRCDGEKILLEGDFGGFGFNKVNSYYK